MNEVFFIFRVFHRVFLCVRELVCCVCVRWCTSLLPSTVYGWWWMVGVARAHILLYERIIETYAESDIGMEWNAYHDRWIELKYRIRFVCLRASFICQPKNLFWKYKSYAAPMSYSFTHLYRHDTYVRIKDIKYVSNTFICCDSFMVYIALLPISGLCSFV
jgi:hypothetical protein